MQHLIIYATKSKRNSLSESTCFLNQNVLKYSNTNLVTDFVGLLWHCKVRTEYLWQSSHGQQNLNIFYPIFLKTWLLLALSCMWWAFGLLQFLPFMDSIELNIIINLFHNYTDMFILPKKRILIQYFWMCSILNGMNLISWHFQQPSKNVLLTSLYSGWIRHVFFTWDMVGCVIVSHCDLGSVFI